jgi:selenocysteine-specific elongation factor
VALLDRDAFSPGETCFAQIRLDEPTSVLKNDRFVIRSYSRVRTIGGGEILNALPNKKKRLSEAVKSELDVLHQGNLEEILSQFVLLGRFRGMEEADLPFLANAGKKKTDEALSRLKAQKKVVLYDKERAGLIHAAFLEKAREQVIDIVTGYHKDFPLKTGLAKEELRSRTIGSENPKLFNHLIQQMTQEGALVQEKESVRLKEHVVVLAEDQERVRRELEQIYLKGALQPPYFKEIKEKFSGHTAGDMLEVLVKDGVLIKIKEDLFFHQKALQELEQKLIAFLKSNSEITTPQFKDMTNASRKYTIPLIEYFDRSQVTVRVGDSRVLRKK